jgi:hypothetical protein
VISLIGYFAPVLSRSVRVGVAVIVGTIKALYKASSKQTRTAAQNRREKPNRAGHIIGAPSFSPYRVYPPDFFPSPFPNFTTISLLTI